MFNLFRKTKPLPEIPFTEQDMLMGILTNDPRIMSHVWGREIYRAQQIDRDETRAQDQIDQVLNEIGRRYSDDPITLSRVLRTMIVVYDVEISTKNRSWPSIHQAIAGYVEQNHHEIEVYQ